MDVYEAIYLRRTVREFKKKEIDADTLKRIIGAGLQAPSNNHLRQWEFIVIKDHTWKLKVINKVNKNLSEEDAINIINEWGCIDECQRQMYIKGIPKQYRMLLDADCIILPCFKQVSPLLSPENLSALNGFASIWCAIENILIAAASEGIYGVTRIPFEEESEYLKGAVNIPKDYEVACYLALGYPEDGVSQVAQKAVQVEACMHFNSW